MGYGIRRHMIHVETLGLEGRAGRRGLACWGISRKISLIAEPLTADDGHSISLYFRRDAQKCQKIT